MSISRRRFLRTAAAGAGALVLPPAANATTVPGELVAGVFRHAVREDGPPTAVWGFNLQVPGPVLRFRQGDEAVLQLRNGLPQPSTVHWHGIRLPNAMDGVPSVTQLAVAPDSEFTYRFTLPDAGTYWYHPHQSSFEQVPRGLYGALVVEEADPLPVDRDELWVLSDFKLGPDNQPVEDFGRITDFGSAGRIGNTVAINGSAAGARQRLALRPNERVRLRLVNASSARQFALAFDGHEPWVIALDGQGVPPQRLRGPLLLAGGQRTDLVLDGSARRGEFAVTDARARGQRLATLACAGAPLRARPLGAPRPLAPNRHTPIDVQRASRHDIVFEGGVLGLPAIGQVDGKALDVGVVMEQHGLTWTMNSTARHEHALMHEPLFHFRRGEHAILRMVNRTDYEHPMHLHGHFFQVLAVGGRAVRQRAWRDTVLLAPRQEMEIGFVAENVGQWMFHCHVLDHAAGGMMGTLAVG